MFGNTTFHHGFYKKMIIVSVLLTIFATLLFSQSASAAWWGYHNSERDAAVFGYNRTAEFLNRVGGYMEVHYQDENKVVHGPFRYTELSGTYYATANGFHTIRFFRPDGRKYGYSVYQTIVNQVQEDTWLFNEVPTFGYDGEDNYGVDPVE